MKSAWKTGKNDMPYSIVCKTYCQTYKPWAGAKVTHLENLQFSSPVNNTYIFEIYMKNWEEWYAILYSFDIFQFWWLFPMFTMFVPTPLGRMARWLSSRWNLEILTRWLNPWGVNEDRHTFISWHIQFLDHVLMG